MNEDRQPADSFAAEVIRGLVYVHHRANTNTAEVHQTRAALEALITLLVERGLVDRDTLDAYRQQAADQLREAYVDRGMTVALQDHGVSKYAYSDGVDIDCEHRIHLCKAACCRLQFALSKEDVEEGIVRWELSVPYMSARGSDGYCVHLDRTTCRCSIHAQRPIPCRGYDCREDTRIWIDFEKRIPNPHLTDPDWPHNAPEDMAPDGS